MAKVEPSREQRRCLRCNTVLTWNPGILCCCCEDKLDQERSRIVDFRTQIARTDYPVIMAMRERGWTHKRIAQYYGVTQGYICTLVNKIQRGEICVESETS